VSRGLQWATLSTSWRTRCSALAHPHRKLGGFLSGRGCKTILIHTTVMQMASLHWLGLLGWLLRMQVLLPDHPGDAKKHSNAWEQGLWAAKVGATTVGIGALFAVTGGGMLDKLYSCIPLLGSSRALPHAALLHPSQTLFRSSRQDKHA
jgi:hypothetical protein